MALMIDIATNPKITWLIGQIEEMKREPDPNESTHKEIDKRYVEIGQYVQWLMKQDFGARKRIQAEGRRWAKQLDEKLGAEESQEAGPAFDMVIDEVDYEWDGNLEEVDNVELTADSGIEVAALRSRDESGVLQQAEPSVDPAEDARANTVMGRLLTELGARKAGPREVVKGLLAVTTRLEQRWTELSDDELERMLAVVGNRARRVLADVGKEASADIRLALSRLKRFAQSRGVKVPEAYQMEINLPPAQWEDLEVMAWEIVDA